MFRREIYWRDSRLLTESTERLATSSENGQGQEEAEQGNP